ncbi:MAG: hypothetical protein HYX60_08790 [Legionella longbeachae]|nr:hypothetical protein [Legionella longbeachae]
MKEKYGLFKSEAAKKDQEYYAVSSLFFQTQGYCPYKLSEKTQNEIKERIIQKQISTVFGSEYFYLFHTYEEASQFVHNTYRESCPVEQRVIAKISINKDEDLLIPMNYFSRDRDLHNKQDQTLNEYHEAKRQGNKKLMEEKMKIFNQISPSPEKSHIKPKKLLIASFTDIELINIYSYREHNGIIWPGFEHKNNDTELSSCTFM